MGEAMSVAESRLLSFNSPFETGLRSTALLVVAFPRGFDLQRLVIFDHLVVHTGDVGGPDSLHPPVPMRSTEMLVRRSLVERGLMVMASRSLIERHASGGGIEYCAGEFAGTFLNSLASPYLNSLQGRANWVVEAYGDMGDDEIREQMSRFFDEWIEQFQVAHHSLVGEP